MSAIAARDKKTGRWANVSKPVPVSKLKYQPGTLVMLMGREDEGPFRVVETTAIRSARTVRLYRESGGKFEWVPESDCYLPRG